MKNNLKEHFKNRQNNNFSERYNSSAEGNNPITRNRLSPDNNSGIDAINGKIAVAMSSGIDSSMAAKILKDQGCDIFGITIKFLAEQSIKKSLKMGSPNLPENIQTARMVCRKLSIPHRILDLSEAFETYIIKPFCRDYLKGLTPNPCVECNKTIKFGLLLDKLEKLGAAYLATGHYCRISCSAGTGLYNVEKGYDKQKDQSYFFWKLNQKQLSRIITPLGDYSKKDIKKRAFRFFPFLKKKDESQDICFITSDNYRSFLKKRTAGLKGGDILDTRGSVVGKHKGFAFYTIGQRKGIGISHQKPLYVIKIIPESNQIVVGERHELGRISFKVENINFISGTSPGPEFEAGVKIRYNSPEIPANIKMISPLTAQINSMAPQYAVAPGQSAVFYKGQTLLGGGVISGQEE